MNRSSKRRLKRHFRMSSQIVRKLRRNGTVKQSVLPSIELAQDFVNTSQKAARATAHGWNLAAHRLEQRQLVLLRRIRERASSALFQLEQNETSVVTGNVREMMAELAAVDLDFDGIEIDVQKLTVSATTPLIETTVAPVSVAITNRAATVRPYAPTVAAVCVATVPPVANPVTNVVATFVSMNVASATNLSVPTASMRTCVMIAPLNLRKPIPNRTRRRRRNRTRLRFCPTAWAKLLFLRDLGPTEIGGFGITDLSDPLYVIDFTLLRQVCTPITVDFAEDAIADFIDQQVDLGRSPAECLRVWIHTHPGSCPQPSMTDEETFQNVFGDTDWSVMFIVASGGASYGRLQCNVGPQVVKRLTAKVDYQIDFEGSDHEGWLGEYETNVQIVDPFGLWNRRNHHGPLGFDVLDSKELAEIDLASISQWVAS